MRFGAIVHETVADVAEMLLAPPVFAPGAARVAPLAIVAAAPATTASPNRSRVTVIVSEARPVP